MKKKHFLFLIIPFVFILNGTSQEIEIRLFSKDSIEQLFLKKEFSKTKIHENEIEKEIEKINGKIYRLGYVDSKLKLIEKKENALIIHYNLGKQRKSISIHLPNDITLKRYLKNSVAPIIEDTVTIPFYEIEKFLTTVSSFYNEKGYVFAEINLSNIRFDKNKTAAYLDITKNKSRAISKIVYKGYTNFPKSFQKQISKINVGKIYNKQNLQAIYTYLKSVPFVEQIKKPAVLFTKDSTLIYVYLKKKKTNQFDGLVGFGNNENSKGLQFQGNLSLELNNILNKGEAFSLFWESTQTKNKQLNISLKTPYIFNSKMSPAIRLSIFSQDSSFINLKSKIDLGYSINQNNKISAIALFEKSTSLQPESIDANIIDYNSGLYGLKYEFNKTRTINSKSFYNLKIETLFGKRQTSTNNEKQKKIFVDLACHYTINRKNSILLKNGAGLIESDNLYKNELYRIGGNKNLRGFQEKSIIASFYSVLSMDYQYKTNETAYLYSITDLAYVENKQNATKTKLLSLGVGYSFKLKNNYFDLSYSLGKQDNSTFKFNKALIHFKIITFF